MATSRNTYNFLFPPKQRGITVKLLCQFSKPYYPFIIQDAYERLKCKRRDMDVEESYILFRRKTNDYGKKWIELQFYLQLTGKDLLVFPAHFSRSSFIFTHTAARVLILHTSSLFRGPLLFSGSSSHRGLTYLCTLDPTLNIWFHSIYCAFSEIIDMSWKGGGIASAEIEKKMTCVIREVKK